MSAFDVIVERKIQEAMEEGVFDNLPGKGKPLDLTENPYEDPAMRMAYHVQRNNGFSPSWIMEGKEIEAAIVDARANLARSWARYKKAATSEKAEGRWQQALETFHQTVADLNRRILSYNLKTPSQNFHRALLSADKEINRVVQKTLIP